MSESTLGAAAVAVLGLLACYQRLRHDVGGLMAALTTVLILGATPLLRVIVEGGVGEAVLFTALALVSLATTFAVTRPVLRLAALAGAVLVLPFLAPAAAAAPSLFSPPHGLLALTPVVYLAVVGLAVSFRRYPAEAGAMLIALVLWPFTGTGLAPSVAIAAPGLAAALAWAYRRPLLAAAPLVAAAIVWNYWLMVQYTAGTIPKDAPVSFAALVRQQADVHTRSPYIYPFAFPGNLIAAWREGLPLDRYDLLASEARRGSFEIALDGSADRYLLDGWGPLRNHPAGSFRTLAAAEAALVFPLAGLDTNAEIRLLASRRADAAVDDALETRVVLNGHVLGAFRVEASGPTEIRFVVSRRDGSNILRAGYNRLLLMPSRPGQVAIHRVRIAPPA